MNASVLQTLKLGTPEYVVAHAALRAKRGRQPSMPFLAENNPRKALVMAREYVERGRKQTELDDLCAEVATHMLRRKAAYRDMNEDEATIALRGIVTTSTSEAEIRQRIKDELRCPYTPDIDFSLPDDPVGREAAVLVKALGGLTTKNGAMVMLMVWGPKGELIAL